MTLNFPASYSAITLKQFQSYKTCSTDIDKVIAITGASMDEVRQLEVSQLPKIIEAFEMVIAKNEQSHQRTFSVGAKEFGLIPNFIRISIGEYEDLNNLLGESFFENLDKIAAIIYRPITERVGEHYLVEPYNAARSEFHRSAIANTLRLDQFNGAMLFFSTIGKELTNISQIDLLEQLSLEIDQMTRVILETQR